jgi:glycosyltransferase involved in cell wall biosynthesis
MLGTRGVPAAHGGFETAAENIGLGLVARGWRVIVYCQDDEQRYPRPVYDRWAGIERVHIPSRRGGAAGTMWFDQASTRHAAKHAHDEAGVCLTFGYNTAGLSALMRLRGVPNIINMDGLEWKRARWSRGQQAFLYSQERAACYLGNHLIADHPTIASHLATRTTARRISTIAYGAPLITSAAECVLEQWGLTGGSYLTLIARPVPENSVLEVVRAFSARTRGRELVVLGNYSRSDQYQRTVLDSASDEVRFLGAIYDTDQVQALRFHSLAYVHGHQVGGTNPSLVEALGCGNPVIAHDNPYNRWVAGESALYFADQAGVIEALERLTDDPLLAATMSRAARARHAADFTWEHITDQYETVLRRHLPQ